MNKNVVFIIKASQDFIRHTAEDAKLNAPVLNSLFENITDIYIPLLNMLETVKLKEKSKISMVLPPVLCNLLSDEDIKKLYVEYLDKRLDLGKKENTRNKGNEAVTKIVKAEIERIQNTKTDFIEKYNSNLIGAFADNVKKGKLELLATCATDLFVPHYADTKEIISAQIECGLNAYRQYFGETPEGFWIPELGYYPGLENLIKAYGFSYTVLDARSVLLAEKMPSKGIFYPVRTENSLAIFASDPQIEEMIFGEEGYCSDEVYCNSNRDIGFDLTMKQLSTFMDPESVRYSTGFKYFNKDESDESFYDYQKACEKVEEDASDFAKYLTNKLNAAEKVAGDVDFVNLFCCLDARTMKSNWCESVLWLKKVLEKCDAAGLNVTGGNTLLENQYSLEKVEPYYSAKGDGYGEEFLTAQSSWMMRYVKKASERIIDLADRFPNDTGLKTRLLNLGAKELLMAQSTGLIKMLNDCENPEFAERRFKESINAFTVVFDSLGSNTVSTEWLTTLEMRDSIFPWMNYKVFAKKI